MKIAVMGYGTIGSGVVKVLKENAALIKNRIGQSLEIARVLDVRDLSSDPDIGNMVTADYMDIVNDPSIDMVVETMGGVEPAFTFVKAMLSAGKSVTTSNKALVAAKGHELMEIAKEKDVNFTFEASVGGGIPIIRPMMESMAGERFDSVEGIVNGTTNYILARMKDAGLSFDAALFEAQSLGYAEKDPTADVDGFDAARKIAILTSIAAGKRVEFEEIPTEGIRGVDAAFVDYAESLQGVVKLIAKSEYKDGTYCVRVAPLIIDKGHILSAVNGVLNAVYVVGNMLGDAMFYGSGAGSLPTASAVVGDLIEMARAKGNKALLWTGENLKLSDPLEDSYRYLVRIKAGSDKGNLKGIKIQKSLDCGVKYGEEVFVTEEMKEADFIKATEKTEGLCFMRLHKSVRG